MWVDQYGERKIYMEIDSIERRRVFGSSFGKIAVYFLPCPFHGENLAQSDRNEGACGTCQSKITFIGTPCVSQIVFCHMETFYSGKREVKQVTQMDD